MWQSSLWILLAGLICLPYFDIQLATTDPLFEMKAMAQGLLHPDFLIDGMTTALIHTLAFALQAVFIAGLAGFLITRIYHWPGVRQLMAFLRSIHELFWALILMQIFGLSPLTGVLALAIPYSATFARVFAEIFQETPKHLYRQLPGHHFSRFIYSTLPLAWPRLATYIRYRLECALRASVVLGFIGLPTLGFQLESYLKLGSYNEVAALILIFIALVISMRWWASRWMLVILFLGSLIILPPVLASGSHWQAHLLTQFFHDMIPASLKQEGNEQIWIALYHWFLPLWKTQILPGIGNTLVLGQLALVLSALLTLLWFPLISKHCLRYSPLRYLGNLFLVVLRCLPELLLAFIGLIILGPSLLPGILAIGVHNGALLAHLLGRYSNEFTLRSDVKPGSASYFYEVLPRIYGQFLSFTLYRGETILRETAVLGILGIPTLGFFIDSAFEEFRFDRAAILILASAGINIGAEEIATRLRAFIRLQT
jgi:phosphonate transport system permease protein